MAKIYVGDKSIENNKLSVGDNDSTYCYVGAVNFYPEPEVIEYIVSNVSVTYLGDSSTCLLANGRSSAAIRLRITKRKKNKITQAISNIFFSDFDRPDAASCMDADGINWVKYDKTVDAEHLYWNYTDSDVNTRIVATERDIPVQLEYVLQDGHRMFYSVNIRIGTNILCNRYRFKDNFSLPSGSLGTEDNPVSAAGDLIYLTGGNLQHQKRWTSGVTDPVNGGWEDIGAHSISVGIVNDSGLLVSTTQFPLRVASRDAYGNVSWIIPDSIATSGYGINGTLIDGYPTSNWVVSIPTLAKELPNGYNGVLKYEFTPGVFSDGDPVLNEYENIIVPANKVTIYQRENNISYSNASINLAYGYERGTIIAQYPNDVLTVPNDKSNLYIFASGTVLQSYASNASGETVGIYNWLDLTLGNNNNIDIKSTYLDTVSIEGVTYKQWQIQLPSGATGGFSVSSSVGSASAGGAFMKEVVSTYTLTSCSPVYTTTSKYLFPYYNTPKNSATVVGQLTTFNDGERVGTPVSVTCNVAGVGSSSRYTSISNDNKTILWNKDFASSLVSTSGRDWFTASYVDASGNVLAVCSTSVAVSYGANTLDISFVDASISGSVGKTPSNPVSASGATVYYSGGEMNKKWSSDASTSVRMLYTATASLVGANGAYPVYASLDYANRKITIPDLGTTPTVSGSYTFSGPTNLSEVSSLQNTRYITVYQQANAEKSKIYSTDVRYDSSYGSMRNQLSSGAGTIVVDEDATEVYIYVKASKEVKYTSNASKTSTVEPAYLSISKTYGDTSFSVKTSNYSGYKVWRASNVTPSTQFAILDTSGNGTVFNGNISVPSYTYILSLSNANTSYVSSTNTYTVDVNSDVSIYELDIYSTKNGSAYVGSSCIGVSASNSADTVTSGSATGSNYPVNVGFAVNTSTSISKSNFFTVTQKYGTTTKNEFKVNVRQKMKPHEYGFGINSGSDLIYELTTPLAYNIGTYTISINSTKDGVALQPSTSWISLNGNILSSSGISISHPDNAPEGFYNIAFNCNANNTDNVRDTVVTITQKDSSVSTGKVITYTIHQQKRPTIELSTTAVSKSYSAQSGTITVGGISDWNVYKSDTYASWLGVSKTNDSTISWSMTENSSGSRSTSAIVRDGGNVVSKTISFSQEGKPGKTNVKLTLSGSGSQLNLNVNMPLPRAVNITYNLTGNVSVAPYQVTQYGLNKTINPSDLNSSNSMVLARASDWTTPAQWLSITGQITQINPESDDNYTYSF